MKGQLQLFDRTSNHHLQLTLFGVELIDRVAQQDQHHSQNHQDHEEPPKPAHLTTLTE